LRREGEWVAYRVAADSYDALYVRNVDGSPPREVARVPVPPGSWSVVSQPYRGERGPLPDSQELRWTSDGKFLVFRAVYIPPLDVGSGTADGTEAFFRIQVSDGATRVISRQPFHHEAPSVSRDGALGASEWGADYGWAILTVTAAGAVFETSCSMTNVDTPIRLDRDGRFSVPGTTRNTHGGGIPPNPEPVRIEGRVVGHKLYLVQRREKGPRAGSSLVWTFTFGQKPLFSGCE
jgi:hypothetical protein